VSDPKIIGKFVAGFLASAGEVSSVFERKARNILESNGISEVDPDEWYSADKFSNSMHQIEDEVGEKTSEQAGVKMIEVIDELSNLESMERAVELAQEQQKMNYQNYTPETVGQLRYEELNSGNIRIGYWGGWDYPEAFTRGILKGFAQATESRSSVEMKTVSTRDDETHAFEIIE
jgi:hypothetical protein